MLPRMPSGDKSSGIFCACHVVLGDFEEFSEGSVHGAASHADFVEAIRLFMQFMSVL